MAKDIKKITEETKINGRGIEWDTMKEKLKKECKIYWGSKRYVNEKKSTGRKGGRKTKEKGKLINFHLTPGNWKNGKVDDASSVK